MNTPTLFNSAGNDSEINLGEELILNKLISYQLKPNQVFRRLSVNTAQLNKLEIQPHLTQLQAKLNVWPSSEGISAFTQNLNLLASTWLKAMQHGANLQEVMPVL